MKWIRPSAAIVFVGLIAVVGLFWWLLADWLLKTTIETVGSKAVGAKVELAAADFTFSPLGFHLDKLQVTDAQQPMQNLFELDSTTGNLELLPLLMGQVIIDELSATGMRFDTKRSYSGAISKPASAPKSVKEEKSSELNVVAVKEKLPTVDDIMAREPLSTLELTKTFKEHVQSQHSEFEKNVASLPDETTLKQHKQRIKELTGGKIQSLEEFKKREKELEEEKDQIRAERDHIKTVRDQIRGAKDELNSQYQALQKAPLQDWDRIKSRYGFDTTGLGNAAGLLFGDATKSWLQRLRSWANQAQRMLPSGSDKQPEAVKPARGEGRFIHYATTNPLPDFLIRHAALSMDIQAGNIVMDVKDITHQPQILGRPMRLHAASTNMPKLQSIKIDGVIDHVNPQTIKDNLKWSFGGWQLSDISLSKDSSLPLSLTSARADISGQIDYSGQNFTTDLDAMFKDTQWSTNANGNANGNANESWTGRVAAILKTVRQFKVDGKIQGDLDSPQITLRSDLDEHLKQAVAGQLKTAQNELQQKFQARLNTEVENSAGPYKDQLAFLNKTEGTMDQRINQLDDMLKVELKSAVDSKKQEATDKLKDKIKGLKF